MFSRTLTRMITLIAAIAVLALSLPGVVHADGGTPVITVTRVSPGSNITVRADAFPANQDFTVYFGKSGTQGKNGAAIGTLNTGKGGSFEFNANIPADLKSEKSLVVRLESKAGVFAYATFDNGSNTSGGNVPVIPVTGPKPSIEIIAVDKDKTITVRASNFPANQDFTIRVGPYYTFFRDYVVTGKINSGKGGSFDFNVTLPDGVKGKELVSIRLDSPQGRYAYNAFKNVSSGTIGVQPTPAPVTGSCSITSTQPGTSMATRNDFDAVWTVKNTGTKTWDMSSVDYKYVSGTKLHKYNDRYDMKATVKPGESVEIRVDMLAPTTSGSYTTTWAIVEGSNTLCSLPLTITVK